MFAKILENKITLIVGAVLAIGVIGVGGYLALRPQVQRLDTVPAAIMDIQQSVTASGSIDSDQDVSLSFQTSGTVAAVDVSVGDRVEKGDVLASLDQSDLDAQLLSAEADVASAAAETSIGQGASSADIALSSAVQNAYLKAEDAVLNKTDTLFTDPTSPNPTITIPLDSYSDGLNLNSERVLISTKLALWNDDIIAATSTSPSEALLAESSSDLGLVQGFITELTAETNRLTLGNSGLSESQIAAYIATMNSAATEINDTLSQFNTALQGYKSSAGGLQKAQAEVAVIEAEIGDGTIVAPFAGLVASVDPKVGEAYSAAVTAIDMVSAGTFKIDLMIPENQVAGIKVGDPATLTFDAGPDLTATATVASIDLAPTVTDGVSAYKTTLYLDDSDPRIRVGMTANATILDGQPRTS